MNTPTTTILRSDVVRLARGVASVDEMSRAEILQRLFDAMIRLARRIAATGERIEPMPDDVVNVLESLPITRIAL